jgi:TonB-linked SusC/RagA family outer membrane protein
MRKIFFLFTFLAMLGMQVMAQRQITGTVTNADDGSTIPGVSVFAKGTTAGTVTDLNGKFTLTVPAEAKVLTFSFVGMVTQEVAIGSESVINVNLKTASTALEGVVVTALGVTREKKALGYAVQDVKGDELTKARETNVVNSLSGRVAGLQVTGASGNMGGSSRVLIRGVNSVSGNNNPLFVVDGIPFDNSDFNTVNTARGAGGYDYGNMAQDINSDDIESISVLKGGAAAALYGSRAANGVILITTKKGKMGKGKKTLGISLNSGVSFEKVAVLPNYQNLYGGGSEFDSENGFEQVEINGTTYNVPDYGTDESWGPKYNANIQYLPFWSLYDWEEIGKPADQQLATAPWVAPENDVDSFFETGVTFTNNVALTGSDENGQFRMSYTNVSGSGYMPNSKLRRNTFNMNGSRKFSKFLEGFATANYVKSYALGRAEVGYGDNNVMQKFNQWGQRQLDMKSLEKYRNADGTMRTWNRIGWNNPAPHYSDNPYWTRYMNAPEDQRDRFFGNAGVSLTLLDWLKLTGKYNFDTYTFRAQEHVAVGSQAQTYYSEDVRQVTETNAEFLFQADKQLNELFRLNATFGGNRMFRTTHRNYGTTQGGLAVPDFYNINNTKAPPLVIDNTFKKAINSLYGSASLGYKGMLFLDMTLRNDWSSTLPTDNRSYLYPSVTGSFVFSEMPALEKYEWLSFGKVRAGWAKAGNDTDPYSLLNGFDNYSIFDTDIRYSVSNTLNNPTLKPESTTSFEIGTELKFFNNRLGIDFTYYSNKTTDQLLALQVSGTSGYQYVYKNAGEMTNKGIELMLTGTPLVIGDFKWDVIVNFAKNNNEMVSLAEGVETYRIGTGPFIATIEARVGEPYGQIYGTDFVYDANGNKVIGTNGRYLKTSKVVPLGSVLPDWNAGITNAFSWKGFDASVLIDIQHGGKIFSTTNMWGMYSGILEESAGTNHLGNNIRDEIVQNEDGTYASNSGGVLLEGVIGKLDADGNVVYLNADGTVADGPVQNAKMISGGRYSWDHYSGPAAQNVFDASYIKLREVRIGYTIPNKYTGPVQNLRVSVYARNLAIWGQDNPHIDPETTSSSGNIQGIEGGALPSLRTIGFNLSCNL